MAEHPNTHKPATKANPTTSTTKTPIPSTNKPSPNVPRSRVKKHKKHHSNSKTLSYTKPHDNLPPHPQYDPSWRPVAVIHNRYGMGPLIDSGSFGSVHSGVDMTDNYRYVAIKLEPTKPNHHPQLEKEYKIYRHIRAHMNNNNISIGIPNIHYFGRVEGHPFNALILEMLGPSLERLFNLCNRTFSVKTVLMIADQMLSRLECIHDTGYLHRDLKPDNFLMGIYNSERVVYAVDLGLGKSYIDHNSHHVAYTEGKTLTGTARYASVNTHLGVAQSRRDDLESLAYIFMYFLRGRLPWQGIKAKSRHEKYEKIARKKLSTLPEQLCKGFPEEFAHLIRYSWRLGYEERPNYEQLRRMFREVFFKMDFTADWEYDWDIKGMSVTRLALKNHPFVRGNMDRKSKRHKNRDKDRTRGQANDCKSNERYCAHWGGDKHHEHRRGKPKARHSLPGGKNNIINAHIQRVEKDKYTSCLPINAQNSPGPNNIYNNNNTRANAAKLKRQKNEKRFWDFSCFNSQPRSKKTVNTEKFMPVPDRRQSVNIISDNKKRANRAQISAPILAKKRLSQPINVTQPRFIRNPIKHQYYQQSPAYSPAHIRHGNNSNISPHTYTTYNTYATYTPSYSHQSSSPSPINMHSARRYSDNYAHNKPIITTQQQQQHQQQHAMQSMGGYIINAPTANPPLRIQRSQSQRLHGRRSVVLNDRNDSKKTSAQLHDEWKQKYANNDCHSTYPYIEPPQPQPQPPQQPQPQPHVVYNYNSPYFFPPTPHPTHMQMQPVPVPVHVPVHVAPQYNTYHNNFPDLSFSIVRNEEIMHQNKSQMITDLDNINDDCDYLSIPRQKDIPRQKERNNTCTLPLKQGLNLKKRIKTSSPSPISSTAHAKSPRSKGSNKSNKSNKSHRSSRNHSGSKEMEKNSKSKSNSPILEDHGTRQRQRMNPKSANVKFVRSNSQKSYHSTSSSVLVNASRWNGERTPEQQEFIKSRMSVIADNANEEDMEQIQEDDDFKMLGAQFTGRSLTNTLNTVTKDEKERKNSASTSKGLFTEDQRDFSSHTETINAQRRQTTPRSYTRNTQHPFVKNSSNSSTQQTVSSELLITNKQKHTINNNNIPIMEEDLNLD